IPFPKKCTLMDLLSEKTNPSHDEFVAGKCNPYFDHIPKIHTIRHDEKDRWKPGMKIHPIINNRTKNRFQFAPVVECQSVQKIKIKRGRLGSTIRVEIDDKIFYYYGKESI